VYLDTHVAIGLAEGSLAKLSRKARKMLESGDLAISPAVLMELGFLHEIGRIRVPAESLYSILHEECGVALCSESFSRVARASLSLSWTRDPFDRLIVVQASLSPSSRLVTADARILSNFSQALS
jgi:PIN domain nuclease of toxin-antitoxin system